ncbi:fumarate/nitrate reduction transcriptional regulator Fnr [Ectothiorhodospiraceae bacterium WFHF3C12]|nr:fumarate/nitrate reduction transcriptional regulator Fnr [Ectothiorhodospiraceae bacterium WFHF3C12]
MSADTDQNDVVKIAGIRNACGDCSLYQLCLPVSLSTPDVERLEKIVQKRRPLGRGDHLYRAGDTFRAVYAIKAGSMKTYTISEDGEEQVTGFHLPGEMVGLDAINSGDHPCSAVALETASICEIPFDALEDLASKVPGLQRQLLRIMSKEIFADHEMLQALAKRTAEERLAIVLLSLSDRFARRGLSPYRFRLTMSRSDLSNYLGLAPETMSRLFKRFHDKGWMRGEGKEVELSNITALRLMAGRGGEEPVSTGRHGHG